MHNGGELLFGLAGGGAFWEVDLYRTQIPVCTRRLYAGDQLTTRTLGIEVGVTRGWVLEIHRAPDEAVAFCYRAD
jgi:hypothetical protein